MAPVLPAVLLLEGWAGQAEPGPAQPNRSAAAAATTSPGFPETGAGERTLAVRVRGGAVTPAAATLRTAQGTSVALTVTSDVADEIHVHGYDVTAQVRAGQTVTVRLRADLPGSWDVEMHDPGVSLLRLIVKP